MDSLFFRRFDVTYEASYIPFLYDSEAPKSDEMPGPSSTTVAVNGRRTFRGGQEVLPSQTEIATSPQEEHEEDLRYSSPDGSEGAREERDKVGDRPPKKGGKRAQPRSLFSQGRDLPPNNQMNESKPQFLRPAGVDVPAAGTTGEHLTANKRKSGREMLSDVIASAKSARSLTGSSPAGKLVDGESNNQPKLRRKDSEEGEETRPRKKPKKSKGGHNS